MGLQTENFHRHTSNWGLWELSVVSMYYGPCLYYKHEIETTGLLSWEPTWTLDNIVMLIYVLHFDIFQCCVTHVWWHLTTHLNYSPAAKCLNFLLPLWYADWQGTSKRWQCYPQRHHYMPGNKKEHCYVFFIYLITQLIKLWVNC